MQKRTTFMVLVSVICLLVLSFAGCRSTDNTNSSSDSSKVTSGPNKSRDNKELDIFENIPEELVGTTVKYATWIDHTKTEAAQVLSDFTAITGIEVKLVNIPQKDYITKLTSMIAANQAPDVIKENGNWPLTLTCLQPLSAGGIDASDPFWNQKIVETFTVGGKAYLVDGANSIWNMVAPLVIYNKTLFSNYNIKTPEEYVKENNWTWETFKKAMRDIVSIDPTYQGALIDVDAFTCSYNALWVKYDPKTGKFSNVVNSDMQEAYTFMLECKEAGLAKLCYAGIGASSTTFKAGKGGMTLCGGYALRTTGWLQDMNADDLAFTFVPKRKASDPDYPVGGTTRSYGICKGAKNPVAGGYFLRYFLNGDNYDLNEVFLSDASREFYYVLRERMDLSLVNWAPGVYETVYSSRYNLDLVNLESSAQVGTTIAKIAATMNECINKANEIIESAKHN